MAANPKAQRRLRSVDDQAQDGDQGALLDALDRVIAAIDRNTEATEQLRVALCGAKSEPQVHGAIGGLADALEAQKYMHRSRL